SANRRDGALASVPRLLQGADRDLSGGLAPLLGNAVLDLQHEGAARRSAAPRAARRGGPLAAAAARSVGGQVCKTSPRGARSVTAQQRTYRPGTSIRRFKDLTPDRPGTAIRRFSDLTPDRPGTAIRRFTDLTPESAAAGGVDG